MDTSAIARIKTHYSGGKERLTLDAPAIAHRPSVNKIGDPFTCLVFDLYSELLSSERDFLAAGVDQDKFKNVRARYTELIPFKNRLLSLSIYIERYPAIEEVEADVIELVSKALDGSRRRGYLSGIRMERVSRILAVRETFDSLTVLHPRLQDLFAEVVDVRNPKEQQDWPWADGSLTHLFTDLIKARDSVFIDYSSDTLKSYCDEVRVTLERGDLRRKVKSERGLAAWVAYQTKIEHMMTAIEVETMLDLSLTA